MGIPFLTGKVRRKLVRRTRNGYAEGVFFIDGYNLALCRCADPIPNLGPAGSMRVQLKHQLSLILALKPSSINFYIIAYIPKSKHVALERRQKDLDTKTFQSSRAVGELILEVVQKNFPEINTILTGMEAEDVMIHDIQDSLNQNESHRCFIFSNDSDFFTYRLSHSDRIFIVPSYNGWLEGPVVGSYKLSDLRNLPAVIEHAQMPDPLSGKTVRNPKIMCLQSLSFENSLLAGHAYVLQTVLPVVGTIAPYKAAEKFRHAAFCHMMDKIQFAGDVEEYTQVGASYRSQVLSRLPSSETEAVGFALQNETTIKLMRGCLQPFVTQPEADAAIKYVEALLTNEEVRNTRDVDEGTNKIAVYLLAICISMVFAGEVFECNVNEFRDLIYKIEPRELQLFIS